MLKKFILGDCMNPEYGLPSYPDKYFDLAIVDPPYGININMNMGRKKGQPKKHLNKKWDKSTPSPSYFIHLFRVSKNQIIWGGNYYSLPLTKAWFFWDKQLPFGVSFADGELAWTSFDFALKKIRLKHAGFHNSELGQKIHPTQKPVKLYQWLLENYAQPGQLILDTHVGSASSLIACEQLGFDYVGFEIDPDYYEAAQKRMQKGIQSVITF